ncbi:hypothetical protein CLIB1444_05S04896 [[Candida] jaroonii]|uniref:Uncharacterized protein n=1 Tax=[Candida] jaroonii TaxID=467808 RepID=A0ACA9Y825_9ASCO|nr:hypothetical protein CLIB1444_05S04896 [[Candida] jaroonii]
MFHSDNSGDTDSTNLTGSHLLQTQNTIPQSEIIDSITSSNASERNRPFINEDEEFEEGTEIEDEDRSDIVNDQPTVEQIQRVYYTKGLEELESLKLLDLSPLANWKLSSFKPGFAINQLRDDTPDSYWQSDGSNGSNNNNSNNNSGVITNNQLSNPHSITIQFSKRVSLERISIFTNYNLDESYTPSKIKIMAGSSDGWDLSEVCTVNFNKPVGWSHIIFNGIRNDGVLKCFMVKLIILANHQDGKDTHIRALKCFGKKLSVSNQLPHHSHSLTNEEILKDLSLTSAISNSGFSNSAFSNSGFSMNSMNHSIDFSRNITHDEEDEDQPMDKNVAKYLNNASNVIGFNTGFQSLPLKSVSNIR